MTVETMHTCYNYFDKNKTGDLSSRLNNDCSTVSNALSLNINILLRNSVNVLGVMCFMLALSWPLTAVTLASVPPTTRLHLACHRAVLSAIRAVIYAIPIASGLREHREVRVVGVVELPLLLSPLSPNWKRCDGGAD